MVSCIRQFKALYKGRRAEAENGVVLLSVRYGPPYELPVGQNVGHVFGGVFALETFVNQK